MIVMEVVLIVITIHIYELESAANNMVVGIALLTILCAHLVY